MDSTVLVLRSQPTFSQDPNFDITLPEAEAFRLKMKAVIKYMTVMGGSVDEAMEMYQLSGDDLVRFIETYPEGHRYAYLFEEEAAY